MPAAIAAETAADRNAGPLQARARSTHARHLLRSVRTGAGSAAPCISTFVVATDTTGRLHSKVRTGWGKPPGTLAAAEKRVRSWTAEMARMAQNVPGTRCRCRARKRRSAAGPAHRADVLGRLEGPETEPVKSVRPGESRRDARRGRWSHRRSLGNELERQKRADRRRPVHHDRVRCFVRSSDLER